MLELIPSRIIQKKRDGGVLTDAEIGQFVTAYAKGTIPDYQMAAFLMAVFFREMTPAERSALTTAMIQSGTSLSFPEIPSFKVDKHSTGGVGDKTSLILAPIVAACGVTVPMISGRGLGHTGGTLDKLESIPGFNTQLSLEEFRENLHRHGLCFIGQTPEICPADKKMYALRDVTATVECLSLISASIMSKKIAEGINGLVLDVKFGSGAFMKPLAKARELARSLTDIGVSHGLKVTSLLTNMNQPLGYWAGNAVEVSECIKILKNEPLHRIDGAVGAQDTRELSLVLAAQMLKLAQPGQDIKSCREQAERALSSGAAFEKFVTIVRAQGGSLEQLPHPQYCLTVNAPHEGVINGIDTEAIGWIGVGLRMGRRITSDQIEPTAGISFEKKLGEPVSKGDPIAALVGPDLNALKMAQKDLLACYDIGEPGAKPQLEFQLIAEVSESV